MKIFILGLIPVLEECCWIIPREVVNTALGLSDLLKKKKKKINTLVLTCLNTVIVLNSVRLGILLKVAVFLVLSLTSVLTAINFQRNYLLKHQVLGNWLKQMLIQNLEIMCRLTEFAAHQHSRVNEALLSVLQTICHKKW